MPRTTSPMSWLAVGLPRMSYSRPGVGWWPVMPVVRLSRMMKVMSWPSFRAWLMAICPEWKKVESPMNTTCLLVMKGSMPLPVPPPSPMPL